MTNRRSLVLRILADILVGISAAVSFVFASHSATGAWAIIVFLTLLLAGGTVGYLEPDAKRVWIHPLVIMSPELIALPVAFFSCHGFECGGVIAFLMLASLLALVLVGLSYIVFYVRRRIIRSSGA